MTSYIEQNVKSLDFIECFAREFFSDRGISNISFNYLRAYFEEELVPLIEVNGIMLSKGQITNFHIWPCFHFDANLLDAFSTGHELSDLIIRIYYKDLPDGERVYSYPRWAAIRSIDARDEREWFPSLETEEWTPIALERLEIPNTFNCFWDYTKRIPDQSNCGGDPVVPLWFELRYTDISINPIVSKDGGIDMNISFYDPSKNRRDAVLCYSPLRATKEDLIVLSNRQEKIKEFFLRSKRYTSPEGIIADNPQQVWYITDWGCTHSKRFNVHGYQLKLNSYSVKSRTPGSSCWEVHFLGSLYFASLGIKDIRFILDVKDGEDAKHKPLKERASILVKGNLKENSCPIEIRVFPEITITEEFLLELRKREKDIPDIVLKQEYGYDLENAGGFYENAAPWPWVAICEWRGLTYNNQKNGSQLVIQSPPIIEKKEDYEAIRNYLISNGVRCFYHFTDKKNLKSIRQNGGLHSWKSCEENGIAIHNPGGSSLSRELDMAYGLADYVRLSFCKDHPMAYRLYQKGYNLVLLKIKVDVAWLKDTLFSDINAADSDHHHGGTLDDLKRVNLEATQQEYVSNSSPIFKQHQAEVLVRSFIPLKYIINISSPETMVFD